MHKQCSSHGFLPCVSFELTKCYPKIGTGLPWLADVAGPAVRGTGGKVLENTSVFEKVMRTLPSIFVGSKSPRTKARLNNMTRINKE